MQHHSPCPAAEQIRLPAFQCAGAGTAQHEAQALVLDKPVDLVQQRRHFLHFVDEDGLRATGVVQRKHPLPQRPRRPRTLHQQARVQQVEVRGLRKEVPQQGRFARLARPPEERRLASRKVDGKVPPVLSHFGTYSGLVRPFRNVLQNEVS